MTDTLHETTPTPGTSVATPVARARRPKVELEPLEPGLAARYYTDERVAVIEKEHVFERRPGSWSCHETDLPKAGSRDRRPVGPAARSSWSAPRAAA